MGWGDVRLLNECERSTSKGRRALSAYAVRTNLTVPDGHKYAPLARPVAPATAGCVIAIPQVGGLHHRYERRAA
jgi:hypothetical protein